MVFRFARDSLRWREMDSNHRSPVKDQLVETVLFDFPAEVRKRTNGGRRSQPRDLGGDLRRDHNLRDDNDRLGWGRRQAQNGGSPDGGPMVRILLPPAVSQVRTRPHGSGLIGGGVGALRSGYQDQRRHAQRVGYGSTTTDRRRVVNPGALVDLQVGIGLTNAAPNIL